MAHHPRNKQEVEVVVAAGEDAIEVEVAEAAVEAVVEEVEVEVEAAVAVAVDPMVEQETPRKSEDLTLVVIWVLDSSK